MLKKHADRLTQIARRLAAPLGVFMSVGASGDHLEFLDDAGDPICDDGDPILAATANELEDGSYVKLFPMRALYAATVMKLLQIDSTNVE